MRTGGAEDSGLVNFSLQMLGGLIKQSSDL